jgi:integrase/recombinase XerD
VATLIKRKNGIFYIVSCKRDKRVWRSLFTTDVSEAQRIFGEKERAKKGRGLTLMEFMAEVEPLIKLETAQDTSHFYGYIAEKVCQILGNKKLSAYTTMDFEKYKLRRSQEVRKVTVNKELRTIKALFQRTVKYDYLEKNPAQWCTLLKIDDKHPTFLSIDQFQKLLSVIDDQDFKDLVIFAVMTAMRAGEIAFLEWADVDFATWQMAVVNKSDHRIKTGKERAVPMNDYIITMLTSKTKRHKRVFLNTKGEPWKVKAISDRFRNYRRKAGLPIEIHFHSLRHTSLTWMHHKGVPSESLRQIAGHSSIQTTQIYTHALPHHLLDAANTLDKNIFRTK